MMFLSSLPTLRALATVDKKSAQSLKTVLHLVALFARFVAVADYPWEPTSSAFTTFSSPDNLCDIVGVDELKRWSPACILFCINDICCGYAAWGVVS